MVNIEIFKQPVKRSELPALLNCSDREARSIVSKLAERYNIINLQDGRGYFLADDETALKYAEQEWKRGISVLDKANKIIKRCGAQSEYGMVVPVRAHFRHLNKYYTNKDQIDIFEMEELYERSNFRG